MTNTKPTGTLASWYRTRIGEATTNGEVNGYWLFVVGVLVGVLGILAFFVTAAATMPRGIGYALLALSPVFIIFGAVVRFPLRRAATFLSGLGASICVVAVLWFLLVFPEGWSLAVGDTGVILAYVVGLVLLGAAGAFVPLVTDPLRAEHEALETEAAASAADLKARHRDLRDRDRDLGDRDRELADARERGAGLEEQVAALETEIDGLRTSQARFELYEDSDGEHRWRLRHRNGNVVANSGEGYTRKHNAQKGVASVRRNALGAGTLRIEPAVDDAGDPADADAPEVAVPTAAERVESQASFDLYEDSGGEYRWRLRHRNGNVLADSGEGYANKSNGKRAMNRIREHVVAANYLEIDPAAYELYRDRANQWRWRLLHENGNILADSGEGYASRSAAKDGVESVRRHAADADRFEVYEDAAGEHRWRLTAKNGEIVADSGEGYASEDGAEEAVERIRRYGPDATALDVTSAAFEIYEDAAGEHRWRLRHRNGNIIADSGEGYSSRSAVEAAIHSVKRNAPGAAA